MLNNAVQVVDKTILCHNRLDGQLQSYWTH
jgi:hypothetical protein